MKYSILGFNQQKLVESNLDLSDALLLDYIGNACAAPSMIKTHDEDEQPYVWLKHKKVLDDLPVLGFKEEMLKKRLRKLCDLGFIRSIVKSEDNKGRRAYYTITKKCEELRFSDQVEKITLTKDDQVEKITLATPKPSVINYPSDNKLNNIDNKLNSNSTNVELEQPTVTQSNTPKRLVTVVPATLPIKEKKKNLYEQCMDLIDEYTQDRDVNEKLKEYLLVRLERKDKPFGVKTFGSILKKLSSLSQIKSEQLRIIQYSIDGQYPSFYELRSAGVGKKRDIFNEFGIVKSVAVNKEAILDEKF